MTARDFLEQLLPSTGVIFTATPTDKGWRNVGHTSLDSAVAHVNNLTFEGRPAYFALATFEKEKYWDEASQKWRRRTQENAKFLRSFFLDLDVAAGDDKKFASKAEALLALKDFTRTVGLPRPMLVDSGGGIHAYWPLLHEIPVADWRPLADTLKAVCVTLGLRADMAVPSDQARVLRCLGSFNVRRGAPVQLLSPAPSVSFVDFAQRLRDYVAQHGIMVTHHAKHPKPHTGDDLWGDGNLGATNEPGHFDRITFACAQLQLQAAAHGAGMSEPLWRAGLGIAKFCDTSDKAAQTISNRHSDYDPDATRAKLEHWNAGPTTCVHFHQLNPDTCEACPHWQTITSPIQLGRVIPVAPAPVVAMPTPSGAIQQVQLPDPPTGYSRRKDGAVVVETEDSNGNPSFSVVCPVDLYPISLDRQNGTDSKVSERSWWRAHLPDGSGSTRIDDFEMENKLLANNRELFAFLLCRGIYMTDDQAKATGRYMSAYLKKLATETGRNHLYERLGWQDEHQAFVLGQQVLRVGGAPAVHKPTPAVRQLTSDGLKSAGTLQGWQQAMAFYNRPGYEAQRFFLYCALGAPLMFIAGEAANTKGALVLATGSSGRGKTMCLKACSSVWGNPNALVVNGNKAGTTVNALYEALGTIHSLPFLWDELTQREADELRDFLLNVSQGKGKLRLGANSKINEQIATWETIVLATANTDISGLISGNGRDADAHQRRLISVEFALANTSAQAKAQADRFLLELGQHHGHVGPALMAAITANLGVVKQEVVKNVALIDSKMAHTDIAGARMWGAVIAAAYTGAKIAASLGLIPFNPKADLPWMIRLIDQQCETIAESTRSATEVLTAFLNDNLRQTLTISAKAASNLDNIDKEPIDRLIIRNERDCGTIWAEVNAVKDYFLNAGRSYLIDRQVLVALGIVVDTQARKNIGGGTRYGGNGSSRCWRIDATKLEQQDGQPDPATPPASMPTNVTPLRKAS